MEGDAEFPGKDKPLLGAVPEPVESVGKGGDAEIPGKDQPLPGAAPGPESGVGAGGWPDGFPNAGAELSAVAVAEPLSPSAPELVIVTVS